MPFPFKNKNGFLRQQAWERTTLFWLCILALNRIETTMCTDLSLPIKKPIKIIIYVYSCNIIFLRMISKYYHTV